MVTSIARQSVIIKCNMQKSILTGNYEFYYAAGLLSKLTGLTLPEESQPEELFHLLSEKLPELTATDEKEAYLFQLILGYRPNEEYDAQMQELFLMGKEEKYLWMVNLPS